MLTLLCGLPGSGKTTWRKAHANGAVAVCLDEIREELTGDSGCQEHNDTVMRLALRRLRRALAQGSAVVVDATNATRSRRATFVRLAERAGVPTRCVYFPVSLAAALERNSVRERVVPFDAIVRMARLLEEPRASEGFGSILVVPTE